MKIRFACLTLALLATAACRNPGEMDVVCTQIFVPGIRVTVLDSVSGAAAGRDSKIVAREGAFADSTPTPPTAVYDGPFGIAYERKGTYALTVSKTGYRDWTRTGIVVTADQCHVRTVDVTAKLQQ